MVDLIKVSVSIIALVLVSTSPSFAANTADQVHQTIARALAIVRTQEATKTLTAEGVKSSVTTEAKFSKVVNSSGLTTTSRNLKINIHSGDGIRY